MPSHVRDDMPPVTHENLVTAFNIAAAERSLKTFLKNHVTTASKEVESVSFILNELCKEIGLKCKTWKAYACRHKYKVVWSYSYGGVILSHIDGHTCVLKCIHTMFETGAFPDDDARLGIRRKTKNPGAKKATGGSASGPQGHEDGDGHQEEEDEDAAAAAADVDYYDDDDDTQIDAAGDDDSEVTRGDEEVEVVEDKEVEEVPRGVRENGPRTRRSKELEQKQKQTESPDKRKGGTPKGSGQDTVCKGGGDGAVESGKRKMGEEEEEEEEGGSKKAKAGAKETADGGGGGGGGGEGEVAAGGVAAADGVGEKKGKAVVASAQDKEKDDGKGGGGENSAAGKGKAVVVEEFSKGGDGMRDLWFENASLDVDECHEWVVDARDYMNEFFTRVDATLVDCGRTLAAANQRVFKLEAELEKNAGLKREVAEIREEMGRVAAHNQHTEGVLKSLMDHIAKGINKP